MKKTWKIINKLITTTLTIFTLVIIVFTIFSLTNLNKTDRLIFKYQAFIVLSDSMKDTFKSGDIIFVKKATIDQIEEGDIITFRSTNTATLGELVTHKVRKIDVDENGKKYITTYGTTTGYDDEKPVYETHLIGVYQFRIVKAGSFFYFLKTPTGYILFMLVPFIVLISFQAFRTFKIFKQYKKEKNDEIKIQQEKLEEERLQMEAMKAELERLKQQMNQKDDSN